MTENEQPEALPSIDTLEDGSDGHLVPTEEEVAEADALVIDPDNDLDNGQGGLVLDPDDLDADALLAEHQAEVVEPIERGDA